MMNEILDKSFDPKFDKIQNLTWYPWVGIDYSCDKRRILIIGESHYAIEDTEEKFKARKQELANYKSLTRDCLYEVLVDKSWNNNTYHRLMEALYDRGVVPDDKTALSRIAYYNFIQRQLDYRDKERPNISDYRIAWECFLKVIALLHPTDCIFVGIGSRYLFEEIMENNKIPHKDVETFAKINSSYPQKTSINLNDDNIDIIFIQHSSIRFSPDLWHDFLKQQLPEAMKWLNRE